MKNIFRDRGLQSKSDGPLAPDLVSGQRAFGFRLLNLLAGQFPGRDILFSPANLGFALALLQSGSTGSTRNAIAGALGFRDDAQERLDRYFLALKDHLGSPAGEVDLAQATALWVRAGLTLDDEFMRRGREWFDIEVSPVDFGDPQTRVVMDAWVRNKTRGLIGGMAGSVEPESILLLTSALYFKGLWALPFEPRQTRERGFTTHDGNRKQVPMMVRSSQFHYLQQRGFQAVRLDYKGSRISLYLFLPDDRSDLTRFQAGLTAANWGRWMGQFKPRPGTVILPRFKVQFNASLDGALRAMGLGNLFDPATAQLEGLLSDGTSPFLSGVHHQAILDLDEEGTEAAAATDFIVAVSYPSNPPKRFIMQIDRPFFFAIQDNTAGIPLFLGSVLDLGSPG